MHFAAKHHALIWVAGFAALIGIAFLLVKGSKTGAANVAAANSNGTSGTAGDAGYTVNYVIPNPPSTTPTPVDTPQPPTNTPPTRTPPPPPPAPKPPINFPPHPVPSPAPTPAPSTTPAPTVAASSIPWFSWFYQDYTTYRNQHGISVPSAPARVTLGSPLWSAYENWSSNRFAKSG